MRKNNYLLVAMASIVLSVSLMLGGCGGPDAAELIEQDISKTFDTLVVKEGDAYEAMKTSFVEDFGEVPGVDPSTLYTSLLDGFNYSVDGVQVDEETGTAVAKMTIKIKSMSDIFTTWLTDLSSVDTSTFDGMSEDEMATYSGELLMTAVSSVQPKEATIEIHYVLNKEGGWELAEDENLEGFAQAMLGDLGSVSVVPEEDAE